MRRNQNPDRDKKERGKRVALLLGILLVGFIAGLFTGFAIGKRTSDMPSQKTHAEKTESGLKEKKTEEGSLHETAESAETAAEETSQHLTETAAEETSQHLPETTVEETTQQAMPEKERIDWNEDWTYADASKIHDDCVVLYHAQAENRNGIVIAVNAGHGTPGGSSVKTMCHPDGSPKVTGGSTAAGEIYATAVSSGMTFLDGTEEAEATLSLAVILKEQLLAEGYDVLMIRETDNCQIDNIARTVYANENADCHIALHYDASESDKGFFFISVPDIDSYRSMEPVASHWKEHMNLGNAILSGMKTEEIKIFGDGSMPIDLTQTSYSTIPSVDVEVGDRASDISEETQTKVAAGIVNGIKNWVISNE